MSKALRCLLVTVAFLLVPAVSSFARGSHNSSGGDFGKFIGVGVVLLVALAAAVINASRKPKPISQAQVAQLQAEAMDFLDRLEAGKVTPPETPLLLGTQETALLNEPSKLIEGGATRVYSGAGTRIEGIYVGGGQSASVESLKEVDSGTLTLTTKRLVFTGSMQSRVVQFKDIVSVQAMGDAIEVSIANRAKRQIYLVHNPIVWGALLRTIVKGGGSLA
jgi:hypothetical protein